MTPASAHRSRTMLSPSWQKNCANFVTPRIFLEDSEATPPPFVETCRFQTRREIDGTWTVYDVFTGWPTDCLGRPLDGLKEDASAHLCVVVNALDRYRRRLDTKRCP